MGFAFATGTTDGTGAFDFTQGDDPACWRFTEKTNEKQIKGRDLKPILIDSGECMNHMIGRFSNVNESVRTCPAAMGFAFAAGTTDGTGAFDFTQGDDQLVGDLLKKPNEKQIKGRDPKPILIDSGEVHEPYDWAANGANHKRISI
nr:neutral/alkaline nonlysosomal ceramidase [Tanacetum cinerariifolium]